LFEQEKRVLNSYPPHTSISTLPLPRHTSISTLPPPRRRDRPEPRPLPSRDGRERPNDVRLEVVDDVLHHLVRSRGGRDRVGRRTRAPGRERI